MQGLVFMEDMPERFENAAHAARELRRIAKKYNIGVGELSIQFIKGIKGVASLVIGAETAGQVTDNLAFFKSSPLSEACMNELYLLGNEIPIESIMNEILKR